MILIGMKKIFLPARAKAIMRVSLRRSKDIWKKDDNKCKYT